MWPTLDAYSLPARGVPFAAVVLPPLVLLGASAITTTSLGIASGLVITVGAAIAGQLGRDRGRSLQPKLWQEWGGNPAVQRLRFRDAQNPQRVERLHKRLERVLDETLPTAAEENANPASSDEHYEEVVGRLRALTGDQEEFRHLFAENVNYGQRRNMLGLKPAGIFVAVVTAIGAGLLVWLEHGVISTRAVRYGPGGAVSVLMLVFWLVVVRPGWVRVTAEAYAEQLVAGIEKLYKSATAGGAPATSD
jgi:hypothetical protein